MIISPLGGVEGLIESHVPQPQAADDIDEFRVLTTHLRPVADVAELVVQHHPARETFSGQQHVAANLNSAGLASSDNGINQSRRLQAPTFPTTSDARPPGRSGAGVAL